MLGERLFLFLAQGPLGDCRDLELPGCDIADNKGSNVVADILSVAFLAAGSLSILFIVIGGFRYVISAGDPNGAKQAKDTILYAVVGLLLSTLAWAIVNFVAESV